MKGEHVARAVPRYQPGASEATVLQAMGITHWLSWAHQKAKSSRGCTDASADSNVYQGRDAHSIEIEEIKDSAEIVMAFDA